MHLHTAAAVYKEATRPATVRVGPPPFPPPLLQRQEQEKCNKVAQHQVTPARQNRTETCPYPPQNFISPT